MNKRYYVCDKCGNPIENLTEFLLQWKHNVSTNRSSNCKITHEKCSCVLNDCIAGTITCERSFDEVRTKTKLLEWISVIQKLNLQEHESFFNCLKRLLNGGDLSI